MKRYACMAGQHPLPKAIKILLSILAALVLIVIAGLVYLGTPYFAAQAGTWLTHRSGRNVVLQGRIEAHWWSLEPHFILHDVKVGNAEWGSEPTMFEARRVEFSIRLTQLLRGRLVMPELIFEQPKLLLEKNDKGDANWHLGQNPQAAVLKQPVPEERSHFPIIGRLRIDKGRLTYRDPRKHIDTTADVSTASGKSTDIITINSKGSFQKQPFLIHLTGASVLQLRESNAPYPLSLHVSIGDTTADADGTVSDPVKLSDFDVTLRLKGRNAVDLFPILGIALPPTPPYEVRGHLAHEKESWHFQHFAGRMGNSDLKGDIYWHPGTKPPYFEGNFVSDNLDMADLKGFIGAHRKPADPDRVIPDTSLDISRLIAMDADVDFHGRRVKESEVLDDFHMKAHLKNGTLALKPVTFGIRDGKIAANITIEGRKNPPPVAMEVNFEHLSMNALFAPLAKRFGKENVSAGILGGKATLSGTGKSLQEMLATSNGTIGIGMEGGQLSDLLLELIGLDLFRSAGLLLTDSDKPVPMHCVVGVFDVNSGVVNTRDFLIETDVTTIQGTGSINLKNEEMDLRLHTYPKHPSPFSAHAPIVISGTLKHPKAGPEMTALAARGGVAAALALLAPPAAFLAFLEPGLGKKSHCASFIHDMEKHTGATPPVNP